MKPSTAKPQPAFAPAVDAYINKSAAFAQPILAHLRELVHEAAPEAEETLKWSMPFFLYRGIILANMAAFKAHCSFGIWGRETADALREQGLASGGAMGSLGRITQMEDLPSRAKLISLIRKSARLIDTGERTKSIERPKTTDGKPARRVAKPPITVPRELAAALRKNKAAQNTFDAFPPSCKKEYIDWIVTAKRDATRIARLEQAVVWMEEGKRRMWKYESC